MAPLFSTGQGQKSWERKSVTWGLPDVILDETVEERKRKGDGLWSIGGSTENL